MIESAIILTSLLLGVGAFALFVLSFLARIGPYRRLSRTLDKRDALSSDTINAATALIAELAKLPPDIVALVASFGFIALAAYVSLAG